MLMTSFYTQNFLNNCKENQTMREQVPSQNINQSYILKKSFQGLIISSKLPTVHYCELPIPLWAWIFVVNEMFKYSNLKQIDSERVSHAQQSTLKIDVTRAHNTENAENAKWIIGAVKKQTNTEVQQKRNQFSSRTNNDMEQ